MVFIAAGSACAVTRTHNSAVDHIIKARQAHVTLKSESLALQKRTATILTSFKTLERDLTPHTDSIKSLCYELPTATPQRCAVIGNLINGLLTICCGSISTCWGGGGGGWIWPIPPPRPSNYWPVPPPWVPGGSCVRRNQYMVTRIIGLTSPSFTVGRRERVYQHIEPIPVCDERHQPGLEVHASA